MPEVYLELLQHVDAGTCRLGSVNRSRIVNEHARCQSIGLRLRGPNRRKETRRNENAIAMSSGVVSSCHLISSLCHFDTP